MENLVEKANNTIYGLAAGVVTNDIDKAFHVANNIRAGTVWLANFIIFDLCTLISSVFSPYLSLIVYNINMLSS